MLAANFNGSNCVAVVLSKMGESYKEYYRIIEDAILDERSSDYYCRVNFISLEYDTASGYTAFQSLENGKFYDHALDI